MQIRVLGSAAGGGFPQWNCGCANCAGIRSRSVHSTSRTQSCVAVGRDEGPWFLLNASPDVARQIEQFAPLQPGARGSRSTGISGVLVTNADLDHTLGLLQLREGGRLHIHATDSVRDTLNAGLNLQNVLTAYCGVTWSEPPHRPEPLNSADGVPSGLLYNRIPLPGKPPRYTENSASARAGDCIGYMIVDSETGGRLAFLPDVGSLQQSTLDDIAGADVILFDGTFWKNDEMARAHGAGRTAEQMGHLPIEGGSFELLSSLPAARKIYVHINNTNPILLEDSPERERVERAGLEVAFDGMELFC